MRIDVVFFCSNNFSTILQYRNQILYLAEKYQTVIIIGETGCGKSTQIPQVKDHRSMFHYMSKFIIGCSVPKCS